MTAPGEFEHTLVSLQRAFDQSFAEAPGGAQTEQLDFLSIRVLGDPYALRLSEIQSLHASRRVVPAPSRLPELLGMAGFRGVLTPVYDLARLLGYGAESSAKWLIMVQHTSPIAFAFGAFEAHLRVTPDHVSKPEHGTSAGVRGAVRHEKQALPLLHLPSLVEGIAQRIKAFGSVQER